MFLQLEHVLIVKVHFLYMLGRW